MSAEILRVFVALLGIAVVAVILFQQPKESGMGAFTGGGGGASSTVFGAKGSGSFLFKLTGGLTLAFAIVVVLLVKVTNSDLGGSVLSAPVVEESVIPGQQTDDKPNATDTGAIPGAVEKSVSPEAETATDTAGDSIPGASAMPSPKEPPKEEATPEATTD